eukprot:363403-Chlamydomonas_euryale.AAC.16
MTRYPRAGPHRNMQVRRGNRGMSLRHARHPPAFVYRSCWRVHAPCIIETAERERNSQEGDSNSQAKDRTGSIRLGGESSGML